MSDEELLDFPDRDAWREWLEANHDTASEVWLVHQKKASTRRGLRYGEGVEEALCFGWIDSLMRRIDDETFMQRYSPRKPGSVWSLYNVERVERLIAEGRMTPAGLALVDEAKRSGAWDEAYADREPLAIPEDLERAMERDGSRHRWDAMTLSRRNRYVRHVEGAKRQQTRETRIERILADLGEPDGSSGMLP